MTGTGFVAASVIQWNGSARTTTFVSATSLQAPIADGDLTAAGDIAVRVVNPVASGGASNAVTFSIANPAPAVTSVSPIFITPGGPQLTLTVNGSGFVPSSVIRWNGSARATNFVNATQLTAVITAADIAVQSQAQVTVFNATPGGGTSSATTISVGNPTPSITQLNPLLVRPGQPGFTLSLAGTGFVAGSTVTWNGAARTTTFVSDRALQVAIPAGDIAAAGSAQIVATNPAPGGGASNPALFRIAAAGVFDRVSVASDGSEANDHSDRPSMSADARFIAFTSAATNLVAGDTNGVADIFVRDTCAGATGCTPSTQRISVATNGAAADGASDDASISANGRYIAFTSTAANLVAGDTNGVMDVFVRDTCATAPAGCTAATTRVSVATDGSQANLLSGAPSISGDGRYVGFVSSAILVLGDINGVPDAFVRDTCAGASGCVPATTRVSMVNNLDPEDRGSFRYPWAPMAAVWRSPPI